MHNRLDFDDCATDAIIEATAHLDLMEAICDTAAVLIALTREKQGLPEDHNKATEQIHALMKHLGFSKINRSRN